MFACARISRARSSWKRNFRIVRIEKPLFRFSFVMWYVSILRSDARAHPKISVTMQMWLSKRKWSCICRMRCVWFGS